MLFHIFSSSPLTKRPTIDLIIAFVSYSQEKLGEELNLNASRGKLKSPVLFLSIQRWPKSAAIMSMLLEAGAYADQTMNIIVEHGFQEEIVTVVLWSLLRAGSIIDDAVINLLIENSGMCKFAYHSTKQC
jgi:hypothetical protein